MAAAAGVWSRFVNSAAGPKTIFFWAPAFKWALVIAQISDLKRPANKLSVKQTSALTATGVIWARYATVIDPVNPLLFLVNAFVALTGGYQLLRIYRYRQSLQTTPPDSNESKA
ncbi:hypothetical protein EMCRGX_G034873 [Ephydatia muelleri]|eukprot:Em0023g767a